MEMATGGKLVDGGPAAALNPNSSAGLLGSAKGSLGGISGI